MKRLFLFLVLPLLISCNSKSGKPAIGFLDLVKDETLDKARKGFYDALAESGFDEKNIDIIYRNAQGDQPTLLQACDYLISQDVKLIATNPTLSTITAVQRTKRIPIFMMVSPRPDIAKLTDSTGKAPENLFGAYETLDYIDTAIFLIKQVLPNTKTVGTIFNQSEPQSVDALKRIEDACRTVGMEVIKLPVNNSNETQLVTQSLLSKKIDVFFALPDNTVFSSMEVIVKTCDEAKVPVFTSEEGLVARGATAGFGADMYQWGFQAGKQAAAYLKGKPVSDLKPEIVNVRHRVYNQSKASFFGITFDSTFTAVK